MRSVVSAVVADEPDATLAWNGRIMKVDAFRLQLRNECAIHRWDMFGDDETSWQLLSQPELLAHSVSSVGARPLCARGVALGAADGRPLSARVRTDGQADLLVTVSENTPSLRLTEPVGEPTVVGDQAAWLLMLWGRKLGPAVRLRATGPADDVTRLQRLLSGV